MMKVAILLLALCSGCLATTEWDCQYEDPRGYFYDLRSESGADFDAFDGLNHFYFRLCDPTVWTSSGSVCASETQVCQVDGLSSTHSCGVGPPEVLFSSDPGTGLDLHTVGGDLCSAVERTRETYLQIRCPTSENPEGTTHVVEEQTCEYHITVYTEVGCSVGSRPAWQCVYKDSDSGFVYDLTNDNLNPASDTGDYFTTDGVNDYFFRLCEPTETTPGGAKCAEDTQVCQQDSNGQDHGCGVGPPEASFSGEPGSGIDLSTTNGDECYVYKFANGTELYSKSALPPSDDIKEVTSVGRKTNLNVRCPTDANPAGTVLASEDQLCSYEIIAYLDGGCGEDKNPETEWDCQYTDPDTGYVYTLNKENTNPRSEFGFYQVTDGVNDYYFNLCDSTQNTPGGGKCVEGTQLCQKDGDNIDHGCGVGPPQASFGRPGGQGLTLSTSGGDFCPKYATSRSTNLNILCPTEKFIDGYVSVSESSCVYDVDAYLDVGCGVSEFEWDCIYTDEATGTVYDLRSESNNPNSDSGLYSAMDDTNSFDYTYLFRLCDPVGQLCKEGTQVCQKTSFGSDSSCGVGPPQASFGFGAGGGITLSTSGGDFCGVSGSDRVVDLNIRCPTDEFPEGTTLAVETSVCVYTVTAYLNVGCGVVG